MGLCARSSQFSLEALRRHSTDQCRTINIPRNSSGAHDPEQIQPAVISWLKSLEEPASSNAPDVVVQLDNGELDRYLKLGWRFCLDGERREDSGSLGVQGTPLSCSGSAGTPAVTVTGTGSNCLTLQESAIPSGASLSQPALCSEERGFFNDFRNSATSSQRK